MESKVFNINGIELEFDMFDVETAELYETSYNEISDVLGTLKDSKTLSELYRSLCAATKKVFDDIFGNGTGERICGERDNFKVCLRAFQELTDEALRQRAELDALAKETQTKYAGNRAVRRA